MTTLKFADTHNMVAFLAKPTESEGFEQIVDFLNAHTINSKTTAWNEFSSTMASAIIYLATNQKFNFSKYIFESMVKNLDNVSGKFLMYPRSRRSKRKDTEVPQPSGPTTNVADEAVNEEMDGSLVRVATTATDLEAEQDSGSGPKRQETMGYTIAQTRSENISKLSNDPLLTRVLALETTKTTQATEITDEDMFSVNDLDGDEVIVKSVDVVKTTEEIRSVVEVTAVTILVSAATTTTTTTAITDVEMTLAQALAELKSANPRLQQ
ncbi:hypothetical protein Tco_0110501 [Tanacetum coccineum]